MSSGPEQEEESLPLTMDQSSAMVTYFGELARKNAPDRDLSQFSALSFNAAHVKLEIHCMTSGMSL